MNRTRALYLLLGLLFLGLIFSHFSGGDLTRERLAPNAVVLAFGDSLTYGYGAVNEPYPLQLEKMVERKVINAGVSGEVSLSGLKRLPKLLEMYHPSLVILCHGGNDILRRSSKESLKANLVAMIELSRKSGAQVLLVGVPGFGLLGLSTVPLYEEVAEEQKVLYEGTILEQIENEPSLKSDQIHPNGLGYSLMAEAFAAVLRESGVL